MSRTHFKSLMNPEFLGSYSLEDGKDIVLTIDFIRVEPVTGSDGKKENLPVCHWKENQKGMILNATNMKMIAKVLGSSYVEDWSGRQIQIGIEKVRAFGDLVEALRVRKFAPRTQTQSKTESSELICEGCGQVIKSAYSLTPQQIWENTFQKYGKHYCADCGVKANEATKTK